MSSQLRFQLVMTKRDAIEVACRELEDNMASWLTTAQRYNPNTQAKAAKENALTRARECQQAISILRGIE